MAKSRRRNAGIFNNLFEQTNADSGGSPLTLDSVCRSATSLRPSDRFRVHAVGVVNR